MIYKSSFTIRDFSQQKFLLKEIFKHFITNILKLSQYRNTQRIKKLIRTRQSQGFIIVHDKGILNINRPHIVKILNKPSSQSTPFIDNSL